MIKIEPVSHFVLIQLQPTEKITAGGIYVPDTVQDVQQRAATLGTIRAIGPQAWKDIGDGSPWAKVGDVVCFPRYSGVSVDPVVGGEENLVIMNDEDLRGVVR